MDKVGDNSRDLVGCSWIGNREILNNVECGGASGELIGVFATDRSDVLAAYARDQWAIKMGCSGNTVVGTFRYASEMSILKNVLKHGGRAVWILDRKFPARLGKLFSCAILKGRLLVISCFWRNRSVYGTKCYCADLVQHLSTRIALWTPADWGHMEQILLRARRNKKRVEVYC